MRFEGQRTLKPTTYHPERFIEKEELLIEIIVDMNNKYLMKLYFISPVELLDLTKKGNLKYTDFKSGMTYNEDSDKVTINVYDAYSVETLRIDYDDIDKRYFNAIEKVMIYANGRALPAVKHHRKVKYPNPMGYTYSLIMKKEG